MVKREWQMDEDFITQILRYVVFLDHVVNLLRNQNQHALKHNNVGTTHRDCGANKKSKNECFQRLPISVAVTRDQRTCVPTT